MSILATMILTGSDSKGKDQRAHGRVRYMVVFSPADWRRVVVIYRPL
jgi:hypothetical protein